MSALDLSYVASIEERHPLPGLLKEVYAFLEVHLLYWLEALSLKGDMSQGVVSIMKLVDRLRVCTLTPTYSCQI
jgi:hypothetical protein